MLEFQKKPDRFRRFHFPKNHIEQNKYLTQIPRKKNFRLFSFLSFLYFLITIKFIDN